jgi:phosphoheptose isomerase
MVLYWTRTRTRTRTRSAVLTGGDRVIIMSHGKSVSESEQCNAAAVSTQRYEYERNGMWSIRTQRTHRTLSMLPKKSHSN